MDGGLDSPGSTLLELSQLLGDKARSLKAASRHRNQQEETESIPMGSTDLYGPTPFLALQVSPIPKL